jgi:hypothetical protein
MVLPMADIGKKRIHSLVQDEGLIEGHEPLKSYITNYYKGPSGAPKESSFLLKETRTDNIVVYGGKWFTNGTLL